MLRSFRIRNFRCLEDLEIPNLARVNLFVGDNDAGKKISYRPLRAEYKGPGMESPVENELMLDPNTVFAQKQNIPADLQGYFFSTAGPPGAQTVANHLSE